MKIRGTKITPRYKIMTFLQETKLLNYLFEINISYQYDYESKFINPKPTLFGR